MEETSFKDGSVQEAFRKIVLLKLNIDDAKELTYEFKVKSVPWLLVVDPFRRDKVAEHVGFASAAEIVALLERAHAKWSPPQDAQAGGGSIEDVRLLYKRSGFSLETGGREVVVDFWVHQFLEAVEFPDDFDGGTFRVRRSHLGAQATLAERVTLNTLLDFAADKPLSDAWAEVQITRPINVRAGRFKVPMGTQYLPRRDFWDFVEPG